MRSAFAPPPRPPMLLPAGMLRLVSDERLVEQVRAGSERAFEALFHRYQAPLLAFCRHMLRSQEEAEDAVQHTFLAAYRDFLRSEKPIAPRPWLFTIARNRCVSMLRAQRTRAVDEVPVVTDNLAAEVDRREDLRALLADLARLPDDQRAALLLTELSGIRHDEIGGILGCPQERVKALVFQARSSLAADRAARETPCDEIRAQLATLRGGGLRRGALRRHLRDCPGCREVKEKVRLQRRQLGALLPVGPGLGLKVGVSGAVFGSGGVGVGGATLHTGLVGGSIVARVLVGAVITSGGAAGGLTVAAHGGATSTDRPSAGAPAGNLQPMSAARAPDRDAGVDVDDRVPRLDGGLVSGAAKIGLQGDRHAPTSVAAVSAQDDASAGLDKPPASLLAHAAPGDQATESQARPAGEEPAEPVEQAPAYDEQAPGIPPEPSIPAQPGSPGKGHGPAGSSEPKHPPESASPDPRAADPSPPVPQRLSGDTPPQANRPAAPAGQAPRANGQPNPAHRGDDAGAGPPGHATPPAAGPASPPRAAALDGPPAAAAHGPSPAAAGEPGRSENAGHGAGAPNHAKH